jgi:hypothetical protein
MFLSRMPLNLLLDKDLRDHCRRTLDTLEMWLRRLVHDKLRDALGVDYLDVVAATGGNVAFRKMNQSMLGRLNKAPTDYPRKIDAAMFGDVIALICDQDLYRHFKSALQEAFPLGCEQATLILNRLVGPRNALAHGRPFSVRQAEQVICYAGDVIASIKGYYTGKNMNDEFNAPLITKYSDSLGNVFYSEKFGFAGFGRIVSGGTNLGTLRVGEILAVEVEVDQSFARHSYTVQWSSVAMNAATGDSNKFVWQVTEKDVKINRQLNVTVVSKEQWHRYGSHDDLLIATYTILPPGR